MGELDDAATAALYAVAMNKPEAFEHLGLLYAQDGALSRTETSSRNDREGVKGRFAIPAGSLRGLFHNHPTRGGKDTKRAEFSPDDIEQSAKLDVPSYISAGNTVMRYDPKTKTTEEVLAQIPVEEIRRLYLAEGLKK